MSVLKIQADVVKHLASVKLFYHKFRLNKVFLLAIALIIPENNDIIMTQMSGIRHNTMNMHKVVPDTTTFVNRSYQNCLERTPDSTGFSSWDSALINHTHGGKSVAYGFFFSSEFQALNLSNENYVIRLYHTILGREPDSSGLTAWVNALNNGSNRLSVFNGFADSVEFSDICSSMGIDV